MKKVEPAPIETKVKDFLIGRCLPDGSRLRIGVPTKPKKIDESEVPSYVLEPAAKKDGDFEMSVWEGGKEDYEYTRRDGQWFRSMERFE